MALRRIIVLASIASLPTAIKLRHRETGLEQGVLEEDDQDMLALPHPDEHMTAAANWRMSSAFPLEVDPLKVWNPEQRGRAYFPFGHTGARKRLHEKLSRAKKEGTPLNVVVLGGSMTGGHGCDSAPWPTVLKKLLNTTFPSVSVTNLASPGTTSTFALSNADTVAGAAPDVVIVDYAINDVVGDTGDLGDPFAKGGFWKMQAAEVTRMQNVTSTLIRLLLSMPTKPAVVYLETFTHATLFGYTCSHKSSEFPHWAVLKSLNVPTVSYTEAACGSPGPSMLLQDDPATHPLQNIWEDMYGWTAPPQVGPHVKCWVHRGMAHLMAGFFITAVREPLRSGSAEADHTGAALIVDAASSCAVQPVTKHVAFVMWRNISEKYFPARHHDDAWYFGEDVQWKPGWIAKAGAPGLITFDVQTRGGADAGVIMEYFTTYRNVGEVACWLDDESHPGVKKTHLKALRKEQVSLTDMAVVEFPANTTPGTHAFHCRSDGRKFKITSLRSC